MKTINATVQLCKSEIPNIKLFRPCRALTRKRFIYISLVSLKEQDATILIKNVDPKQRDVSMFKGDNKVKRVYVCVTRCRLACFAPVVLLVCRVCNTESLKGGLLSVFRYFGVILLLDALAQAHGQDQP